jgi:hypothetical protein
MDGFLNRPGPLRFEGNRAENWRDFENVFDTFVGGLYADKSNKEKCMILLNLAGREAQEISKSFVYKPAVMVNDAVVTPGEDKDDPECLKNKFRELMIGELNTTIERHTFNMRKQLRQGEIDEHGKIMERDEDVLHYIGVLKILAASCEYQNMKNDLIRDRIVCGIFEEPLRRILLKEKNLTLDSAISACIVYEQSKLHCTKLAASKEMPENDVNYVKFNRSDKSGSANNRQPFRGPNAQHGQKCGQCGYNHPKGKCPAYGRQCRFCRVFNHFESVCLKKKNGQRPPKAGNNRSGVDEVDEQPENRPPIESKYDEYYDYQIDCLDDVTINIFNRGEALVNVNVNGKMAEMKIDTGAKINVMSLNTFRRITDGSDLRIMGKPVRLIAYGGDNFATMGSAILNCSVGNEHHNLTFHIVNKQVKTLIGLRDCVTMGFVKLGPEVHELTTESILDQYSDVFDDSKIGKIEGVVYKMKLNPKIEPVQRSAHRIPISMKNRVKQELDDMVEKSIITPVQEPTEWVSAMVVAKKKDKDELRICIDPRDLNKALLRPHHPLKTIDMVLSELSNAKIFTTLDAKCGFWQIALEKDSSRFTTFATPFGRFRFLRMPYGITSGSEVFQHAMEHVFEGLPCHIVIDDILVWGSNQEEHDKRLKQILDKAREVGLKLNKKKCKVNVKEVAYVGHILSDNGVKVDPEKVRAIKDMPPPTDKAGVQRFLGMTNYVAKFINNLSSRTEILRQLIKNDAVWSWDANQQKCYDELKKCLTSAPTLGYFDESKPVKISCDASKSGLGATLLQGDTPIAYASKSMNETQRKYAQIEKELLAVLFACKKFHEYIYGKVVTVETDHQPLISIMKKNLNMAPTRLQKMMLQLQRYNLNVTYKRGKELYIADSLSRAYVNDDAMVINEDEFEVLNVESVSSSRWAELQLVNLQDPTSMKLTKIVRNGWPNSESSVPPEVKKYFPIRDELTVVDGVVMRGQRVVVPRPLVKTYIEKLHAGHPGIEATKRRARATVFWPNMDEELNDYVLKCSTCNSLKHHQQKEPMKVQEVPVLPWQIAAVDLFDWNRFNYMVVVDSYSGWFDIHELDDIRSSSVISKLKLTFSTHGSPQKLMSDNARQFTSTEFAQFAREWDIKHVTSSPQYPQSNGLAERAVQSAKDLLEKAKRDKMDVYMALLLNRNTPRSDGLGSQTQRSMSRFTRCFPMITNEHLKPKIVENVSDKLFKIRNAKKRYYDKTAKTLPEIVSNNIVRMQTSRGYDKKAVVVGNANRPNSYIVESDGKRYERNRKHLLKVSEGVTPDTPDIPAVTPSNLQENSQPSGIPVDPASLTIADNAICNGAQSPLNRDRPKRIRNLPTYLKDYDMSGPK